MKENKYPLSAWRFVLLIAWYFIGYQFILPYFFSYIAVKQDPTLTHFPLTYQVAIYLIASIITCILAFPLLKKDWHIDLKKVIITILFGIVVVFLCNIVFAVVMTIIDGPLKSANQEGLEFIMYESIPLYALMTGVLAPFLEEVIFRGVLYQGIKHYSKMWIAVLVSSFAFGFIHVSSSIFTGNISDLIYLFLYGGIGLIFVVAYEYNDSIWACILLHGAYNLFALMSMFS